MPGKCGILLLQLLVVYFTWVAVLFSLFRKKTVLFNPILSTGPVMASARGEGSTKAYGEVTTDARGERT